MKILTKIFKKKEQVLVVKQKVDEYQETLNKMGAEQLRNLVSKGLRVPVMLL